jgi:hypothetical protein
MPELTLTNMCFLKLVQTTPQKYADDVTKKKSRTKMPSYKYTLI